MQISPMATVSTSAEPSAHGICPTHTPPFDCAHMRPLAQLPWAYIDGDRHAAPSLAGGVFFVFLATGVALVTAGLPPQAATPTATRTTRPRQLSAIPNRYHPHP